MGSTPFGFSFRKLKKILKRLSNPDVTVSQTVTPSEQRIYQNRPEGGFVNSRAPAAGVSVVTQPVSVLDILIRFALKLS